MSFNISLSDVNKMKGEDSIDFSDGTFKEVDDLNQGAYGVNGHSSKIKGMVSDIMSGESDGNIFDILKQQDAQVEQEEWEGRKFERTGNMGYDLGQMFGRHYYSPKQQSKRLARKEKWKTGFKEMGDKLAEAREAGKERRELRKSDRLKERAEKLELKNQRKLDLKKENEPYWQEWKDLGSRLTNSEGLKRTASRLTNPAGALRTADKAMQFLKAGKYGESPYSEVKPQWFQYARSKKRIAENVSRIQPDADIYEPGEWNPNTGEIVPSLEHGGTISNSQAILQQFNKIFGSK